MGRRGDVIQSDWRVAAMDIAVRAWLAGVQINPDGRPSPRPGTRTPKQLVRELRLRFPGVLAVLNESPSFEPVVTEREIEDCLAWCGQTPRRRDPAVRAIARSLVAERKERAWAALRSAFLGLPSREADVPSAAFPKPGETMLERGTCCPWCRMRSQAWESVGATTRRCSICAVCVDQG